MRFASEEGVTNPTSLRFWDQFHLRFKFSYTHFHSECHWFNLRFKLRWARFQL